MKAIKIPKRDSCRTCHFFTHQGNYQENFCGLYMRHTGNDYSEGTAYTALIKHVPRKPEFCNADQVKIKEPK